MNSLIRKLKIEDDSDDYDSDEQFSPPSLSRPPSPPVQLTQRVFPKLHFILHYTEEIRQFGPSYISPY